MLLEDYFSEEQFDRILFFLKQNGYERLEDLERFSFDDLYFIPGVSEPEREEFVTKYSEYSMVQNETIEKDVIKESSSENNASISIPTEDYLITTDKVHANDSASLKTGQQTTVKVLNDEDEKWIYSYPLRMIERALTYDVKPAILKYNQHEKINTVIDFIYFFPKSMKGVRKAILSQYIDDIEITISSYKGMSEKNFLCNYGERTWDDYYSQLPIKILKKNISLELLASPLSSLFKGNEPNLTSQVIKRLKKVTVGYFIENRDLAFRDFGKNIREKLPEMIISKIFSNSTEEDFIPHIKLLSGDSSSLRIAKMDEDICISKDYARVSVKHLSIFDQFIRIEEILNKYGYHILSEIRCKELDFEELLLLREKLTLFRFPVINSVKNMIDSLSENEKEVLIYRGIGETLLSVGESLNLSRERVRQIENKALEKLQKQTPLIILYLLGERDYFLDADLAKLCDKEDEESYQILLHSMQKNDNILMYISPIERYYLKGTIDLDGLKDHIKKFASKFGKLDELYDTFMESGISIKKLSIDDFASLLVSYSKYKVSGNIYFMHPLSTSEFYGEVIRRYFKNGIKVTQNIEFNEDLTKLIEITRKEFPFVSPSSSARSFCSVLARNQNLIISGRGELTHIANTYIDINLLQEIREYILSSNKPSLLYKQIFEIFSGKLQTLSSITNYHYLHGVLYYYFKDEFDFIQRDQVTKLGQEIEPLDVKIQRLLDENGRMYVHEIMDAIPGIAHYQIQFVEERNSNIFNIDYGVYATIGCLKRRNEILGIESILIKLLSSSTKGYISSSQLFDATKNHMPEFIVDNGLSDRGVLNLAKKLFSGIARYRYPHIVDRNKYGEEKKLDTSRVLWYLFGEEGIITEEQLGILSQKYQWSDISIYNLITELDEEMYRVGKYDYSMDLKIDNGKIEGIDNVLSKLLTSVYRPIQSIADFESFVNIGFEWNGYLVETFINYFSKRFRIIEREHSLRHVLSSVYVEVDSDFISFEEIVAFELKKANIHSISEYDLQKFLIRNGLTNVKVPNELKDGNRIKYSKRLELYQIKG